MHQRLYTNGSLTPPAPARPRRWRRALWGVLLCGGFVIGCHSDSGDSGRGQGGRGDSGGPSTPSVTAVPVEVVTVGRADLGRAITGTTTLVAAREVSIVAEISGRVTSVEVDEGDRVERGDAVARIENADALIAIRQAEQSVARYERERDALQPLFEQGYLSRQAFEETEFQLEQAQVELQRSRTTAGTQLVRASEAGAVIERLVNRGEVVVPNQTLMRVATVDALQANIAVPERELSVLREGQPAEFLLDALGDTVVRGHIDRIHPVVDPTTGTVEVRLTVENPADTLAVRLRPGMFATVRIVTDVHPGTIAVPKRALLYEADTPYVFVVGEEWIAPEGSGDGSGHQVGEPEGSADDPAEVRYRVERIPLELGYEDPNQVEVLSGLEEGARVVVTGQSGLDPSSVITIATGVSRLGSQGAAAPPEAEGSGAE